MQLNLELDEHDLKHFRLIMREAQKSACKATPETIVAGAERLLTEIRQARVPACVQQRLDQLEIMIRMLADHEWRLPEEDSARVLNALAYFCDPQDLIPDNIPGIGYLDDAIMIDLVVQDLSHELEAYRDFCEFRDSQPAKSGVKARSSEVTRDEWLDKRREELQSRMHRLRRKVFGS
jgi:uncharacterized membrane protein YkvA (DUF1232 family)